MELNIVAVHYDGDDEFDSGMRNDGGEWESGGGQVEDDEGFEEWEEEGEDDDETSVDSGPEEYRIGSHEADDSSTIPASKSNTIR